MAHRLALVKAAQEAKNANLHLPQAFDGKSFPTMNQTGSMYSSVNNLDRKFINAASSGKENIRVLEIGCAYGHICLEALKNGCMDYTAVDTDENHLKVSLIYNWQYTVPIFLIWFNLKLTF